MKKLLGITVLGLLLYGCATPVGQSYDLENKKEYVAMTSLIPDGFVDNLVTGMTWGIISPKYYDFYEYADSKSEAEKKSMQECKNFAKTKGWTENSRCHFSYARLSTRQETSYSSQEEINQISLNEAMANATIKAKKECIELGFIEDTNEYADCNLKLSTLYKEEAIEEQKLQAAEDLARSAEANAKANERKAKLARQKAGLEQMEKGLKSLSGKCNILMGNC